MLNANDNPHVLKRATSQKEVQYRVRHIISRQWSSPAMLPPDLCHEKTPNSPCQILRFQTVGHSPWLTPTCSGLDSLIATAKTGSAFPCTPLKLKRWPFAYLVMMAKSAWRSRVRSTAIGTVFYPVCARASVMDFVHGVRGIRPRVCGSIRRSFFLTPTPAVLRER